MPKKGSDVRGARHRPCSCDGAGAPEALTVSPQNRGRTERRMRDASAASCAMKTSARVSPPRKRRTHPAFRTQWGHGLLCITPGVQCWHHRKSKARAAAPGSCNLGHPDAAMPSDAFRPHHQPICAGLTMRSISDNRTLRREPPHPAPRQVTIASRPSGVGRDG